MGRIFPFQASKLSPPARAGWTRSPLPGRRFLSDITHVIIHDAALPAVAYTDIDALIESAEDSKKAAIALISPMRSSLIEIDTDGHPLNYHSASSFRAAAHAAGFHPPAFYPDGPRAKPKFHPMNWNCSKAPR